MEKAEQDKESRDWWHLNGSVCVPGVHHKVSPAVQALPRGSEVAPQHLLPGWGRAGPSQAQVPALSKHSLTRENQSPSFIS